MSKNVKTAKDSDFLSQIPDWEREYKESDEPLITYSPDEWIRAEPTFAAGQLMILGEAVMEEWEAPYMKELAQIACARGGVVLEIGFGMGISSAFIQDQEIDKHIIIEANKGVASRAREFAFGSAHPTVVLEGLWQEVIGQVEDESVDGILFDSYPLTDSELYQNHYSFFPSAFRKLRRGGVLTYFSDEVSWFGEVHLRRLASAGFGEQNVTGRVVEVSPPIGCSYWKANTILAPIVVK